MKFKELVTPSLTDLFIKELQRMILSGELKIGDKLPTERELSENMKVSRAVVNGGLNQLAEMGFIRIAPRKGAYVNDYIESGNMEVLVGIMEYNGWRFTPEYLEPLLQFRSSNEPYFMELAAGHADSPYLMEVPDILARLRENPTHQNAGQLVFLFYHKTALASGNIIFPLILRTFDQVYQSMVSVIAQLGFLADLTADLEAIYETIREGRQQDAKEADLLCIAHTRSWINSHYKPGDIF